MSANGIEQDSKPEMKSAALPETGGKRCYYCAQSIPVEAKVCSECGRNQRRLLNYGRDILFLVSILISFGMVYVSYSNLEETRKEGVKATEAYRKATAAENKIEEDTKRLQLDIKKGEDDVIRIGLLLKEVETEILQAKKELRDIKEKASKESQRIGKVEILQDQATLVKTIVHDKSSTLSEDTLRGQVHLIMGPYTLTLPSARMGLSGTFIAGAQGVISLKAGPKDHIRLSGTPLANGQKISSMGDTGAKIDLMCLTPNTWETANSNSIFIDGGK